MVANLQSKADARWDDVRLFLALYRQRTLASAAISVGLDGSTLSRRLVALEESLGSQLFERTREGLLPTEGAELLLPAAEEMEAAHGRFSRDASGFERVTEGVVRLSVPPGLAESFVAPALVRLRAQHPGLRIELDVSIAFVDLTRREADLAIRTRRPLTGDLVSVKIGGRRWLPAMSAACAKKIGVIKNWADVTWVGWGADLASFPAERWLAKHVPEIAVVLRTSHFTAQVNAIASGLGAGLLPPTYARARGFGQLRHAPALAASVSELPVTESWLVGHRALRAVPRVAAVWTFLVDEFARLERAER